MLKERLQVMMCEFKYKIGWYLLRTVGKLPLKLGGGKWRIVSARLICKECGNISNIGLNSFFTNRVTIGDYSSIGNNCYLQGTVNIGNYVMMGPECMFYTINHCTTRTDIPMCQQGTRVEKAINIADDVWIGARVIVLPGVRIGKGSIIGAGTIVTKDVPDFSVFCGNPGEVVKKRI